MKRFLKAVSEELRGVLLLLVGICAFPKRRSALRHRVGLSEMKEMKSATMHLREISITRFARFFVISYCVFGRSLGAEATTGTLAVPNVNASRPGSVGGTLLSSPDDFYLQTYDASQFASLAQGGYLTALSFRSDEAPSGGFNATYSHLEVLLATFPPPISQVPRIFLTETLARQLYPDALTIFAKDSVRLVGGGSLSPDVPAPFEIRIEFDRPFYYDPRVGNLLMYLQSKRVLSGGGNLDFENPLPNPVGYGITAAAVFQGLPPSQGALVAQFEYTAVPEHSALLISVGASFLMLVWCKICRPKNAGVLVLIGTWATVVAQEPIERASELVVPNSNAGAPGSTFGVVPFQGNEFAHQTYDASQFSPLVKGGYLTGVSFRTQEGMPTGFDATYSHFELVLATFPGPVSSVPRILLTPALARQLYPDASVVFSKDNVHLDAASSTSPAVPAPFDLRFQFDRPFYYDASAGNLLMILVSGQKTMGSGVRVDINDAPSVFGYNINNYAIAAGEPPSRAAFVVQFDYSAVPEPTFASLVILCLTATTVFRYVNRYRTD